MAVADALESQARAHTGLGRAYQALGDGARARRHYTTAVALYERLGSPLAERGRLGLASLDADDVGSATGRTGLAGRV